MGSYYSKIQELLCLTRRRVLLLTLLRGILFFLAAGLAYFDFFCLLDAFIEFSPVFRYIALSFYYILLVAIIFLFLIRPFLQKTTNEQAALFLQKENAWLKDDVINFLQLSGKMEKRELKEASPEITGEYLKLSLKKLKPEIFSGVRILAKLKKEAGLFGSLVLIFAILYFVPPYLMRYSMLRLFDPSLNTTSISGFKALTGVPEIGDLKVKVYYPAYTGLGVRIFDEGGNAEVLKNSKLEISGTTNKPVTAAFILGAEGGREFRLPMNLNDPLKPAAGMVVKEDMEYKIALTDRQGQNNAERVAHSIKVIRDENPQVNMIFPNQELIATPDSEIKVVYEYADDFGVDKVNLVFDDGEKEKHEPLVKNTKSKLHDSGEHDVDLKKAGLTFGDEIWLYVEAFDNDIIDGPKRGVSQRVRIKIPSLQEYLKEENPMDKESFEELLNAADNFKNRQDDFQKQMEKLESGADPDLARMLADLEGLQNDLMKLAEKLVATSMKVPEEALKNAEMGKLDMGKIAKLMQELQDAIQKGDKEAVKRLAKELSEAMGQMMDSLRSMLDASGMAKMQKMMKKAGELSGKVKDILKEEKGIYEETGKEAAAGLKELFTSQDKLIEEIIKKQQDAFDTASQAFTVPAVKNLPPEINNLKNVWLRALVPITGKLLKDFKEKNFSTAATDINIVLTLADNFLRACSQMEKQTETELLALVKKPVTDEQRKSKELEKAEVTGLGDKVRKVKNLEEEILEILSNTGREEAKKGLQPLSRRQSSNKAKLTELKNNMSEAGKEGFPSMAFQDDVIGAEDAMGRASGELEAGESYNAISEEQDAISHLENLNSNMEGMSQAGGGAGGGPMFMTGGRGKGSSFGGGRVNSRNYKLPQKKDYKPPKEFREDIMDSMKEKLPQKYKDLIDEYYKKLLR